MANCNDLFQEFNGKLEFSKKKKDKLITSRKDLQDRIRKHFKENHPEYVPFFWIQGSYKMKTMIRTKEDTCDCDDGVYFFRKPNVSGTTLQKWVKDAVTGASSTVPQHRKKCVRVIYQDDYHIDLPVYYMLSKDGKNEHPKLAVKDSEFEESDPKEFVQWFKDNKDTEGQLLRIIRSLKGWCDHKRNKMPSGLSMTVLAEKNIVYERERDDLSLKKTLENIELYLKKKWQCKMPTTPQDDLFKDYDEDRKRIFFDNIAEFIADAKMAIKDETDRNKASRLWKKHLGKWFPLTAEEEEKNTRAASLLQKATLIHEGSHFTDRNGTITKDSKNAVKNKPHNFYGR